jgi:hypothetical protein
MVQVPAGPAIRPSEVVSYSLFEGSAARAPGGDQSLFEEIASPNQLQLGAVRPGIILSMMTGPTQSESVGDALEAKLPTPHSESTAAITMQAVKLQRELVYLSIRIMKRS